jgi:DNA-binding response OmpR family regulator
MRTASAMTGVAALQLKAIFLPDVALVDLDLPGVDGLDLVARLSEYGDCGIIAMSDHSSDEAIALSLESGADDHIAKPPRPRELVARVFALGRRITTNEFVKLSRVKLTAKSDGIELDTAGRLIKTGAGDHVSLTTAEYKALTMLLAASGKPVSRNRLSLAALRREWSSADRGVDQLIFGLRQKLASGSNERMIHSIRGVGYMLSVGHSKAPLDKVAVRNLLDMVQIQEQ